MKRHIDTLGDRLDILAVKYRRLIFLTLVLHGYFVISEGADWRLLFGLLGFGLYRWARRRHA